MDYFKFPSKIRKEKAINNIILMLNSDNFCYKKFIKMNFIKEAANDVIEEFDIIYIEINQILLVGKRIKVYWKGDKKWYSAKIVKYEKDYSNLNLNHKILYNDDVFEWININYFIKLKILKFVNL